ERSRGRVLRAVCSWQITRLENLSLQLVEFFTQAVLLDTERFGDELVTTLADEVANLSEVDRKAHYRSGFEICPGMGLIEKECSINVENGSVYHAHFHSSTISYLYRDSNFATSRHQLRLPSPITNRKTNRSISST